MSGTSETPASKRFRASQTASSAKLQLESASRRSQFLRASNSTNYSFFTPGSQSRRPPSGDEIESSFEAESEEVVSSPSLNPATRPGCPTVQREDTIEDDFIVQDDLSRSSGHDQETVNNDFGSKKAAILAHSDAYQLSISHGSMSPIPKRRRIERVGDATSTCFAQDLSSPPSLGEKKGSDAEDDGDFADNRDDPDSTQPQSARSNQNSHHRFLGVPLTQTTIAEKPAKPFFRSIFRTQTRDGLPSPETVLPGAFSPSRRRGRQGYTHGGLADTVRNWVLEMTSNLTNDDGLSEKSVTGTVRLSDQSRRFDILQSEESGIWMLIRQQDAPSGGHSIVSDAAKRTDVVLKGEGTEWTVSDCNDQLLNICVLWQQKGFKS